MAHDNGLGRRSVAYVLMAYPRLSETYITSEIHRLEQTGTEVRLFAVKPVEPWEQGPPQPVVDLVRAEPHVMPARTSLTEQPLRQWLPQNFGDFWPALRRTVRRHPLRVARAAGAAAAEALRERKQWAERPPKLYVRHFLRAVYLADALLRDPGVGHMHGHYAHDSTTAVWMASMMTALPFSFTGHARDIYDEVRTPRHFLRRKMLAAEFVVTCTDANVQHLREVAPEAKVERIYHGLGEDTSALLEQGTERIGRNGHMRLLGVGRLVRKKGFDVLVDACGVLAERDIPFEAQIIGPDGDHADELRARIAELGLEDRVLLPGRMGQTDLCDAFRRADIFCMPCKVLDNNDRDGIPNVLVEAMASGAPIVSTPVSGIPELVTDGDNGLLVAPGDAEAFADALVRIEDDKALAEQLGRRAQETIREHFDGRNSAKRLAALFREVSA
jgi:glycosyltransferase involved in cell wall biosynthesis